MKIMVFGATGRVGRCFVDRAVTYGHAVTVFIRDVQRLNSTGVQVYQGDACDIVAVKRALRDGFDAVVVCIGAPGLQPSTVMRDSIAAIVSGMQQTRIDRLLVVSGTAEMPDKTWFGKLYTTLLKRTPIGHAMRDHDAAFERISRSGLNWTVAGCNYLKSGLAKKVYKTSLVFPGGFKIIHPPDVADFLLNELSENRYPRQIVGLWY
jgi:uncharacterized protein